MTERIEKLILLKKTVESGSEHWATLQMLESYFFGEITSCQCKTATLRSKLNRYYENNKNEIPNET